MLSVRIRVARWLGLLVATGCSPAPRTPAPEPAIEPVATEVGAETDAEVGAEADAEPQEPLSTTSFYLRQTTSEGERLAVVGEDGVVRAFPPAHAVDLDRGLLYRFEGAALFRRAGLEGAEQRVADEVAPHQLAVTPDGVLVAGLDGTVRTVHDGARVGWAPPVPLRGTKAAEDAADLPVLAVLASPTPGGEPCVALTQARPMPHTFDQRLPEQVHADGWHVGQRRLCHDPDADVPWRWYAPLPASPESVAGCRGCLPEHVVGPRGGFIALATESGANPRYSAVGAARALPVAGVDLARFAASGGVRNARPVALSADGAHTLLCRTDPDEPWPAGRSRCGIVRTAALADLDEGAPIGAASTTASTSALAWTPVPELEETSAREVALFGGPPTGWPEPVERRPWVPRTE